MSPTLRGLKIGFIGGGTMGRALIHGLLTSGVSRASVRASDASAVVRRELRRRYRIVTTERNLDVVRHADVIVLAVKPQQLPDVLAQVGPSLSRRHLVISIAAGMTLRWLQSRVPGIAVIRVMPNLPATVGCGFSAIAPGRYATSAHRGIARAIFAAVGDAIELPERWFDAITAVSGSGPAYVFFLVQMWEAAAQRLQLPPSVSERAIRQTLTGSVRLLQASEAPPTELIRRVASKGGTTEAALKVLTRRRVAAHFAEALTAAARRSKQLSMS